jgi:hypothetical protein
MLPSYQGIRLSRLTHPRASLIAIVLLAVVFGLFGVVASAAHPELSHAAPNTFEGAATLFSRAIFCF